MSRLILIACLSGTTVIAFAEEADQIRQECEDEVAGYGIEDVPRSGIWHVAHHQGDHASNMRAGHGSPRKRSVTIVLPCADLNLQEKERMC